MFIRGEWLRDPDQMGPLSQIQTHRTCPAWGGHTERLLLTLASLFLTVLSKAGKAGKAGMAWAPTCVSSVPGLVSWTWLSLQKNPGVCVVVVGGVWWSTEA